MKKLFNMYMELPMSVVVCGAIFTWLALGCILISPAILCYVAAWSIVLVPFLGAIQYTEYRHKVKKDRQVFLADIKADLGEN